MEPQDQLKQLQREYAEGLSERTSAIKQEIEHVVSTLGKGETPDYSKIEKMVHKVAGSGGTYGFRALSEYCAFLEDSIVDGKLQELSPSQGSDFLNRWQKNFARYATVVIENFEAGLNQDLTEVKKEIGSLKQFFLKGKAA